MDSRMAYSTLGYISMLAISYERLRMNVIPILMCFVFVFTSCTNSINGDVKNEKFTKTWTSVKRPYPFHADLYIKTDHTFSYIGGGCTTSSTSTGGWVVIADTLILNSKKPEHCYMLTTFGIRCILLDSLNAKKTDSDVEDCYSPHDDLYVTFNNEKFYISSDTLSHKVNADNVCELEMKVRFTSKN